MTALEIGLVSSIYTLGGLFGALIAGPLSTRYGRLPPMRAMTFIAFLGAVGEALAPSIPVMAIGRIISGVAAGTSTVIVPLYLSEISPPGQKGFFGAFTQITTNLGIFITQLLGYFLSYGQMWRWILAAAGIISACQFVALLAAVESPSWNADQLKIRQAKKDLQRIRGPNADLEEEIERWISGDADAADEEEQSLLANSGPGPSNSSATPSTNPTAQASITMLDAFKAEYAPATVAVIAVMMAQQLIGINSIIMYGVSLLSTLLTSSSALLNIFVSILNIVVTTACAPLSDIIGRKTCLLISIGAMGSSSILLGIGIRAAIPILSAVSVLLFVGAFGVGLGPVPFILASELVGPEAVGAIQSWALAANWISTFLVAQFFPILNEKMPKGTTYFLFAALAVFFFIFISWWVPETKGKKDADEVWGREPRRED